MRKSLTLYSDTLSSFSKKNKTSEPMENNEVDGVSPSEQVIRNIMNYSKALSVIRTREELLFTVMN